MVGVDDDGATTRIVLMGCAASGDDLVFRDAACRCDARAGLLARCYWGSIVFRPARIVEFRFMSMEEIIVWWGVFCLKRMGNF